ncbi:MAG: CAP domain-containing protein [Solirubrobacterales bacterium]
MLAILGLCLGGASDARASCPGEFNSPSQLSTNGARSSLFCLVNEERQANGLIALAPNRSLGLAAEHHSRAMDRRNFFGHEPDGSPASRARQAGYMSGTSWWTVGEALAWGRGYRGTPQGAMAAMMASPVHRAVILDGRWHDLGVGVAMGTPLPGGGANAAIYTVDLGVRR